MSPLRLYTLSKTCSVKNCYLNVRVDLLHIWLGQVSLQPLSKPVPVPSKIYFYSVDQTGLWLSVCMSKQSKCVFIIKQGKKRTKLDEKKGTKRAICFWNNNDNVTLEKMRTCEKIHERMNLYDVIGGMSNFIVKANREGAFLFFSLRRIVPLSLSASHSLRISVTGT